MKKERPSIERLHAITEEDAQAEGVMPEAVAVDEPDRIGCRAETNREAFVRLWDQINGKRAPWSTNPWVWRIEFRRT